MNYHISNWLFRVVMPKADPNTFKVVAAVADCTAGWQKTQDRISYTQFHEMTGIVGRGTLRTALRDALENGWISREKEGKQWLAYSLSLQESSTEIVPVCNETSTEPVPVAETTSTEIVPEPVRKSYRSTPQTGTEIVHTNINTLNKTKTPLTPRPKNRNQKTGPPLKWGKLQFSQEFNGHLDTIWPAIVEFQNHCTMPKQITNFIDDIWVMIGFDGFNPSEIPRLAQKVKQGKPDGRAWPSQVLEEWRQEQANKTHRQNGAAVKRGALPHEMEITA